LVFKLREEHRLGILVKRVLRRIVFVREGLGKLYNEELHDFYTSANITN